MLTRRWRDPKNAARAEWNVNAVPTIVRLEDVSKSVPKESAFEQSETAPSRTHTLTCCIMTDSQGKETGRIVEKDILDAGKLKAFLQ